MVLASKVPLPSRGAKVGRLQSREVATQDKQGDIGKKKGKSAAVLARSVVTWTSDAGVTVSRGGGGINRRHVTGTPPENGKRKGFEFHILLRESKKWSWCAPFSYSFLAMQYLHVCCTLARYIFVRRRNLKKSSTSQFAILRTLVLFLQVGGGKGAFAVAA